MSSEGELVGALLGGKYRVVRLLGQGGMGAVYEGLHEELGRKVALKVLLPHLVSDKELVLRFKREAHAAGALGHPNIVGVTDFQMNADEPPFLVMELLTGYSLRELMKKEGTISPRRAAYIAAQALSALETAHDAQIVHRDVKPDNIFLVPTPAIGDLVKVLDFGVAKLLRDGDGRKLTGEGMMLGTLAYMAPEQTRSSAVDGRADVYGVAACVYHAVSGKRPYDAKGTEELLKAILTQAPTSLSAACPDLDGNFCAIVDRGLRKDPAQRWASAAEMRDALTAWIDRAPSASTPALTAEPSAPAKTPVKDADSVPTAAARPRPEPPRPQPNATVPLPAAPPRPPPAPAAPLGPQPVSQPYAQALPPSAQSAPSLPSSAMPRSLPPRSRGGGGAWTALLIVGALATVGMIVAGIAYVAAGPVTLDMATMADGGAVAAPEPSVSASARERVMGPDAGKPSR